MSFLPEFELGLWNAWILIVFMFLMYYAPAYLINKEAMERMEASVPSSKTERILARSTHVIIMPFTVVYSIFLPLKLGTAWFYVGLPICFLALIWNLITAINITTTPLDELVTKGVYRISRNPMMFGIFLMYIGIGITCASWIFLLCAVAWIIMWHIALRAEERFLLEKYGDAYREYLNRTPRWIGIPKSEKRD